MNFRFGEHYYLEGASSFWESVFIAFLASFLGILGSLWIFWMTIKRDQKKHQESNESYLFDRIKYFKLLTLEVLSTAKKQVKAYEELGELIIAHPIGIHLPRIYATNEIERLKRIDSQDVFKGVMLISGNDELSITKYSDFYKHLDFLEGSINQMFESNKGIITSLENHQHQVKSFVDDIPIQLRRLPEQHSKLINDYIDLYNGLVGQSPLDFDQLMNNFLIPLLRDAQALPLGTAEELISVVRKCTTLLHHWKVSYIQFKNQMIDNLHVKLDPIFNKIQTFIDTL